MSLHGMSDSSPVETFSYLATQLDAIGIAYLHVTEGIAGPDAPVAGSQRIAPYLRQCFSRTFILNGGYDAQTGEDAINKGEADLIAYGVPFIANPDLPARFACGSDLNVPDPATFYAPGHNDAVGYTDYPTLNKSKKT